MEDMTTGKLLGRHIRSVGCRRSRFLSMGDHFFTANNACFIGHVVHLLLSCIRIPFIHVASSSAVAHEVAKSSDERTSGNVYIANDIERDAIKCDYNNEKAKIGDEFEEILKDG